MTVKQAGECIGKAVALLIGLMAAYVCIATVLTVVGIHPDQRFIVIAMLACFGLPPVTGLLVALAYTYARRHGWV